MKSTFEIENINWLAVVMITAFVFIFGFVFFNEWVGLGLVVISILGVSFVTGRSKPRVTRIINITPKERDIVMRDKKND